MNIQRVTLGKQYSSATGSLYQRVHILDVAGVVTAVDIKVREGPQGPPLMTAWEARKAAVRVLIDREEFLQNTSVTA